MAGFDLTLIGRVSPDRRGCESTAEAIGDWHYWVARGYLFAELTPVESNRHMNQPQRKAQPKWTDVKAKLASFDRAGLVGLVQDLYNAHPDNRTFLHTRFGLGADILEPYKQTIDRWLWPDPFRNQDTSVAKAKQAISNYKKALGDPAGLAELMIFYCEQASGFASDIGYQDESYFDARVRMFEQSVTAANTLPAGTRDAMMARLRRVRSVSHNLRLRRRRQHGFHTCQVHQAQGPSLPVPIMN